MRKIVFVILTTAMLLFAANELFSRRGNQMNRRRRINCNGQQFQGRRRDGTGPNPDCPLKSNH